MSPDDCAWDAIRGLDERGFALIPGLLDPAACDELAAGYDADLTVVDLKRRETITNRWFA